MSKILISLISLFISISCFAQKTVVFETKHKENKEYKTNMITVSSTEIEVIADEEVLENLKSQGMESPIISESILDISTKITTSELAENGEIPAVMEYGKMTVQTILNGQSTVEELPFSGAKAMGKYDANHKFIIDTIIGDKVTQEMKDVLVSTLASIQKYIEFPSEPMEVGDTFKSQLPMSIPMVGMNPIQINIDTEYLLKEIKGGIAYLDFNQTVGLDMSQEQMNITASGTGSGTSEFNIKEGFLVKYNSVLPMEMTMIFNERMTMNMKMISKTEQTIEIKNR